MKNSTKVIIAIVVLLCAAFIIIPRLDWGSNETTATGTAAPTKTTTPVIGVVARETQLNNDLKVTGSLTANESVTLTAEVSGVVERILFREGQEVRAGQLLVQINDDELVAELEKLQYTKKLNEDIEYRQKQLLTREAISREEYETALTTLNTSLAEIKVKQVQLNKHKVRAPFDGKVGLRQISTGSYVNPSQPITTIYNIDPVKIDFSIPGKYIAELNTGDPIAFTVDGYEEQFYGEIYAVEPQIDPETRSIRVRATSPNKDGKLLPGQFAKITLTISQFDKAIMIPTEAVIPELNGKRVYIKTGKTVSSREIETGIRTADKVQVTSGLSEGDTVVTTGLLQLKPGDEVSVNLTEMP